MAYTVTITRVRTKPESEKTMGSNTEIDDVLSELSNKCSRLVEKVDRLAQIEGLRDQMANARQILRSHEYFVYLHYDIEMLDSPVSDIEETYGVPPGPTFAYLKSRAASEGKDTLQAIQEYVRRSKELLSPEWVDLSGLAIQESASAEALLLEANAAHVAYIEYSNKLPKVTANSCPDIKARENPPKSTGSFGL